MSDGSTTPLPSPEPSSSSPSSSDRTDPGRTEPGRRTNEEEEDRLRQLPSWVRPSLIRLRSADGAVRALCEAPFSIPAPDAVDLVGEYGVEAVEGAILKTLAHLPAGEIRSPRRWLFATLKKGKGWRPDQVEAYVGTLQEEALARLEGSENTTDRRLAADLRLCWGEGPPQVVEFPRRAS